MDYFITFDFSITLKEREYINTHNLNLEYDWYKTSSGFFEYKLTGSKEQLFDFCTYWEYDFYDPDEDLMI